MKKIFGTYRPERISSPYNLDGGVSLNGTYTPSFFLNNQFGDWYNVGLTNIKDQIIPEERYVGEIIPGIKKLTRFVLAEYNENYVDPIELSRSITNVGARFNIDMFDNIEEAREWVRSNCDLQEVEPGKFLISEQTIGINGEKVEATYLEIN